MCKPTTHVIELTTVGQLKRVLEALPDDNTISSTSCTCSVNLTVISSKYGNYITFEPGGEDTPTDTVESFIESFKGGSHD